MPVLSVSYPQLVATAPPVIILPVALQIQSLVGLAWFRRQLGYCLLIRETLIYCPNEVAKSLFEVQKASSLFCLVQNCPAVIWVAYLSIYLSIYI